MLSSGSALVEAGEKWGKETTTAASLDIPVRTGSGSSRTGNDVAGPEARLLF